MGFDIKEMVKSKDALRRKLAERPISEKLRMVEDLSERALALRPDTSPSPPDAPWPIPSHWQWKKMADVATVIGGGTPATDHKEYFGGDIPWITPADLSKYTEKTISHGARNITQMGLNNSGARVLPAGTVLFSSRAPIGYVAIAANPVATNQGFKSFVLRDEVTPEFVYYYLQRARGLAHSLASGTTFLEISGKKAAQIPVPVPPLPEQRDIVAEIEKQFTRLDAGVTALRRVQAKLKRYRAAVLKSACEGRLVPTEAELANAENRKFETGEELVARILTERRQSWQGRGKYKTPAVPDIRNLLPLPQCWTWTNLDAVIVSGPQNGVYLARELYGCGHPILRIDDYQDGWVRGVHELKKVSADQGTAGKYQLLSGDLVINRVNSLTHLGKCLVVRETHAGSLFESNMMKAHLANSVNARYVEFYLRSREGRTRLTGGAKWAVNQASINQEDVKRTPLPLPPFLEQTRIVAEVEGRFSVVEELEAAVARGLNRAIRLRLAVLQRAFNKRHSID